MQAVTITQITPPELESLIESSLSKILNLQPTQATKEIIDRKELCKRLALDEGTIIRYEKKGKIPRLSIGNSIRYNWPAVIEALESGNKKGGRS
jgi:predicted DNA-binding transcriptional regulator AlpA